MVDMEINLIGKFVFTYSVGFPEWLQQNGCIQNFESKSWLNCLIANNLPAKIVTAEKYIILRNSKTWIQEIFSVCIHKRSLKICNSSVYSFLHFGKNPAEYIKEKKAITWQFDTSIKIEKEYLQLTSRSQNSPN